MIIPGDHKKWHEILSITVFVPLFFVTQQVLLHFIFKKYLVSDRIDTVCVMKDHAYCCIVHFRLWWWARRNVLLVKNQLRFGSSHFSSWHRRVGGSSSTWQPSCFLNRLISFLYLGAWLCEFCCQSDFFFLLFIYLLISTFNNIQINYVLGPLSLKVTSIKAWQCLHSSVSNVFLPYIDVFLNNSFNIEIAFLGLSFQMLTCLKKWYLLFHGRKAACLRRKRTYLIQITNKKVILLPPPQLPSVKSDS